MFYNQKVLYISWNWFYTIGEDGGDGYNEAKIGEKYGTDRIIIKINYHQPSGEGDAHYCDIEFDNGTYLRVFNINEIQYEAIK